MKRLVTRSLSAAAFALAMSAAAFANAPPPPEAPAATAEPAPAPTAEAVDPAAAKAAALALKERDIGIGDPNAPVKWIEYASAGCPHCADLSLNILPKLKAEYIDSGKVYYVLRDFPLDNVAASVTVIARCLPREKFYPFMEKLYASQPQWHSPDAADPKSVLLGFAAEQGLDEAGVDACFKRQELLDEMIAGMEEAEKALSVNSTPTSFIGDETVVGVLPPEKFKEVLDKALAAQAGGATPAPTP
ncbi:MAG: DsbA family protein [Micropepsaceae bacterium]